MSMAGAAGGGMSMAGAGVVPPGPATPGPATGGALGLSGSLVPMAVGHLGAAGPFRWLRSFWGSLSTTTKLIGGLGIAAYAVIKGMNKLSEFAGQYNPSVAIARAQTSMAKLRFGMAVANIKWLGSLARGWEGIKTSIYNFGTKIVGGNTGFDIMPFPEGGVPNIIAGDIGGGGNAGLPAPAPIPVPRTTFIPPGPTPIPAPLTSISVSAPISINDKALLLQEMEEIYIFM